MIIFGYVVPTIVVSLVLPAAYVVAGYLQAYKQGEQTRWVELVKSVLAMLVADGLLTATMSSEILEVAGTQIVFTGIDKLVNAFIRKYPLDLRPGVASAVVPTEKAPSV